jgi:hypothetical protein
MLVRILPPLLPAVKTAIRFPHEVRSGAPETAQGKLFFGREKLARLFVVQW